MQLLSSSYFINPCVWASIPLPLLEETGVHLMPASVIWCLRDASQWRHLKAEHDAIFFPSYERWRLFYNDGVSSINYSKPVNLFFSPRVKNICLLQMVSIVFDTGESLWWCYAEIRRLCGIKVHLYLSLRKSMCIGAGESNFPHTPQMGGVWGWMDLPK